MNPTFRRLERGWVRDHAGQHVSNGGPLVVHVTGPEDHSPNHATYPRGYDSRCGWCWLGANHSDEEHTRRLER